MDDSDKEQLQDIATAVQTSSVQLGKIDERTRKIEEDLNSLNGSIEQNRSDVDELQGSVKRNTTILSALTGGSTLVIAWIIEQLGAIA